MAHPNQQATPPQQHKAEAGEVAVAAEAAVLEAEDAEALRKNVSSPNTTRNNVMNAIAKAIQT